MSENNNTNNGKNDVGIFEIVFIILGIIGLIVFVNEISGAIKEVKYENSRCMYSGCNNQRLSNSRYCYKHQPGKSTSGSYKNTGSGKSSSSSSSNNSYNKSSGYSSTGSKKNSSTTSSYNGATVDPSDHDIEAYYEDYRDEFEDEDDAWDDFEDNEEYWDDY